MLKNICIIFLLSFQKIATSDKEHKKSNLSALIFLHNDNADNISKKPDTPMSQSIIGQPVTTPQCNNASPVQDDEMLDEKDLLNTDSMERKKIDYSSRSPYTTASAIQDDEMLDEDDPFNTDSIERKKTDYSSSSSYAAHQKTSLAHEYQPRMLHEKDMIGEYNEMLDEDHLFNAEAMERKKIDYSSHSPYTADPKTPLDHKYRPRMLDEKDMMGTHTDLEKQKKHSLGKQN